VALCARAQPGKNQLLLVLGQTPLFFYLLHFPMLVGGARLFGLEHRFGVGSAYLGAAAVIALLYPVCAWYRGYKADLPARTHALRVGCCSARTLTDVSRIT